MDIDGWPVLDCVPPLPADEIHVWRAELTCDSVTEAGLAETLSDQERARAQRFVQPPDRRRFIVARGQLRRLLGGYLSVSPDAVNLTAGRFGKPYLADATSEIRFNTAHSNELVLFAFARFREIGVDLEFERSDVETLELARRFFSEDEVYALFSVTAPDERRHAFYRCWTRKEAYLKALGEGLQLPLDGFAVTIFGAPALVQTAHDPRQRDRWQLEDLAPAAGFAAAVCVEGHGWRLRRATCAGFG
jgi:4'-phosphopantetheinyl transferase